jgi:hypothetical protein
MRLLWTILLGVWALAGVVSSQSGDCAPGLPPRLTVGESARVTPGNANNVRDTPSTSGQRLGQIPGGEAFLVLDGFVCAGGYAWWQVSYGGLTGWTVEGSDGEYFLEPLGPPPPTATPAPPTPTPMPTPTPAPAVRFMPFGVVDNVLAEGVIARVVTDTDDESARLNVRTAPSTRADVVAQLATGDVVTLLAGSQEAEGFFWWEVSTADGRQGWVVEGVYRPFENRVARALLPLCPHREPGRLAFSVRGYVYTAAPDATALCALDYTNVPLRVFNYAGVFANFAEHRVFWSPDSTALVFTKRLTPPTSGGSSRWEAVIMNADGSSPRSLTPNAAVAWVDWAPDGRRLLTSQLGITDSGSYTRNHQIWTMRPDASLLAALTRGDADNPWAMWLPDSETVLYLQRIGDLGNPGGTPPQAYSLWRVNVLRGGFQQVWAPENFSVDQLVVAPDRQRLLIVGQPTTLTPGTRYVDFGPRQFYVMNTQTGEVNALGQEAQAALKSAYWLPDAITWRPDSTGLVALLEDALIVVPLVGSPYTVRLSQTLNYAGILGWDDTGGLLAISPSRLDLTGSVMTNLYRVDVQTGVADPLAVMGPPAGG